MNTLHKVDTSSWFLLNFENIVKLVLHFFPIVWETSFFSPLFLAPCSVWNKSTKLSHTQAGNGISKARSHRCPIDNLHQQSLVSPAAAIAFTLTAAPAGRRRQSFCSIRWGSFGDGIKRIESCSAWCLQTNHKHNWERLDELFARKGNKMNIATRIKSGAAMLFKKHPIVANCTIYGALYTSADLMQQLVSKYFIEVSNNWVSRQVKSHQTSFLSIFRLHRIRKSITRSSDVWRLWEPSSMGPRYTLGSLHR